MCISTYNKNGSFENMCVCKVLPYIIKKRWKIYICLRDLWCVAIVIIWLEKELYRNIKRCEESMCVCVNMYCGESGYEFYKERGF